jgi:hypothetical protein
MEPVKAVATVLLILLPARSLQAASWFALKEVEPNSGLGKAVTYLLRHWNGLTAFLREAGARLDNKCLRTRAEACGAASQERSVLSHAARRRSRRSIHEPDPHL